MSSARTLSPTSKSVLISVEPAEIQADDSFSSIYVLPSEVPFGDSDISPFSSQLQLFENGVELGPAHSRHERIRSQGGGRFSHWHNKLFFSASDNSSPGTNKRAYQALVPAAMFTTNDALISALNLSLDEVSPVDRFDLARRIYRHIWRDTPLPDHGRRIDSDVEFLREFARLSPHSDVTLERKYGLNELFQLVLGVEGDVAECGTYKGASAYFFARHIKRHGLDKRLCLFDSFEGLSTPGPEDGDYWEAGALTSSVADVERALAPLEGTPFVEFYQGWVPERFADVADRTFCFVHIDVDLYQPTLDSIAFFYPRMAPGGIILLDDYGFESCPGVTSAVDSYMADKAEPIVNLASGGALIMKTKGKA